MPFTPIAEPEFFGSPKKSKFTPIEESPERPKFTPIEESPEELAAAWQGGQLENLTPEQAVNIALAKQKSRLDPMAYVKGAAQGVSEFAGQVQGTGKELGARVSNTIVPETPGDAASLGFAALGGPLGLASNIGARAIGLDAPKVAGEMALRGASDLGQQGQDFLESQVLDPYRVVRKAIQDEGFTSAMGKMASKAPQLLTPGLDKTTALLQVFPTQAAEVLRQSLQRADKQSKDREALQKGERSLLGETASAIASELTGDTVLAEEIGKAVAPPQDLAQTVELGSNFADPGFLESRLVKMGTRVGNVVAPALTKQLSTPILDMGGKAAKVAAAQEAKDRLASIADNNRQAWAEAVQRSDVTAPPMQMPPRQLFPASEAELAKALFEQRAAEAGRQTPGMVQKGVGTVGKAAETGGKLVETATGKIDELADKYEGALSLASAAAGASGGASGALLASQAPGAIRKVARWGQNASRAGTALRSIANTDWASSIPVWRQIAKDPDAPQWLVRGVTANVVGKLKAGELVEKGLRAGTDLGKGILEGAATDAVLTGMDTSKSGEEIGGEAGTGGFFGALGTLPALKSMSNERKALAFSYDSMRKASESIAAGANPLVIAATPDATMHSSVILEGMFRGMLPGRKDLKVDLMDGAQFAQASSDPGAAAYFDESTGRIAVNLESIDADGRQLHEVGHALMSSVAGSNPAIVQHFQQLLGADGLARARQDYQQALGRTVPQDDAFIVGELFSEALANGLRGANLNEALPTVLGRTQTQSFFRDADVRKAIKDPTTLELVRGQFQAASEFRPAVDMEKEPGVKLRPAQAGNHPALPTETRADGTQGNDFVDVTNGQARETPVPVVRARVRSRRREVLGLFPDVPPSGNVNPQASNVGVRQGPSGMTEKTGTRLGEQFYATARSFGDGTKNMLRRVEQAIANNETLAGWYQQIGEGDGWSASVRESLGAMEAQYKDFMPFAFKVDKQGNLLVQNYSLSALERKAAGWAGRQGPLSLEMWNGDIGSFRQDVQTYLKNHAEGRPGSDGLGDMKRNLINVFLVGGNRTFEALNPLRAQAKGRDRQGIVRSYRADRLQTVEPSAITGFEKPDYNKQVRNLSPEARYSPEVMPVDQMRRPNGAIGTQGVSAEGIKSILEGVSGLRIPDGASLRQMVEALRNRPDGQQRLRDFTDKHPIAITELPDGTVQVNDGHHRAFLLDQLGDKNVPVTRGESTAPDVRGGTLTDELPPMPAPFEVRNLTPEVDQQFWEGDSKQFSPAVTGEQPNFTPPQKTIKAYKLFRTLKSRPGELFPLFIGKGESVPVGEWIPAKFIPTKGFAERPGWHAGVLPNAPHLLSKDGTMPSDRVWAEVEIPADVDWQSKANATSTGDIKSEVPAGGYYTFKRPGLQGGSWVIGGALKVNRLLSNADVDKIMSDAGASTSAPVSGQVRNSPPVKLNKKTAIQINSYNHAQQLFDRGYTLYGASNDGFDDSPNLIRTSDEIDRYDPENMVAMVPKSGDPVRNSPNVQTDTPEFKKWFSGSSVVNEDGSPRVMYHGTISSDIGAFRSNRARGQIAGHFAFEPDFASDFAISGHWNVVPEEGINPTVYPVYLSVKKLFDVRDDAARAEIKRLGQPTPRGHDWTTLERPEVVRELRNKGYDGYLDFEKGDRSPPTGIAVFQPTQIKSAIGNEGTFDPSNPDIRKSPKVDRNLVALHNTTEEGIRSALKLGGIPVPSLGVTKKDKAFTGFGDITLIADKATVDPQADPRNRLFNADVYSPRQPRPFQAVSKGARDRLSKRINALKPPSLDTWNDISSGERAYDQVLEKGANNAADTHRNLSRSLDVQAAFLTEKGVQVPRLMKDPDLRNRILDRESLSDPRLAVLSQHPDDLYDFLKTPEGIAVGDDIRTLAFEERGGAVGDLSPEQRQRLKALMEKTYGAPGTPFPFRDADSISSDLSTLADGSKKVVDRFGITEWIRDQIKPREAEFSKWVSGLTADIFEPDQKLIRGTKKVPYTLENVTDAMTGKVRGQEEGGLTHSLGRARSESAVQFHDLDQARAAEGSLMTREGLEPLRRERQNQFDQVVEALAPFDKYPDRNGFDRLDNLSEAMGKIAKRPASAASVLASFDYTGISPQVLSDVRKFALSLRDDPTEYFESKPQRAVGLSEFKAAIVPEGTSPDVVDALKQAGLAVETYTDNADRIATVERVSSEKDLLFSPKVTPEQDAAYLAAAQKGDAKAAQRMVDEAAKAAGYTVGPLWHGTNAEFDKFEAGRAGASYFTADKKYAQSYGPNLRSFYIKADKVADLSDPKSPQYQELIRAFNEAGGWAADKDLFSELQEIDPTRKSPLFDPKKDLTWEIFDYPAADAGAELVNQGFKVFKLQEREGIDSYAVLDPERIKLADPITRDDAGNVVPLSQRFDLNTPDIRFSPKVSFDQPSDKVMDTSAINLLHGTSTVLPPGTKEAPKTLDTIAKNLQEAAVTQWGRIINSYDITPAEYEVIADNAMNECVAALRASGKNAFDWYTTAIARASVIMSVLHPELKDDAAARASGVFPNAKAAHLGMTMAMAITSQNLSVDSNSQYAEEQFSHLLKTGKFDPEKEYGTKATSISSNLALANVLIEKLGWEGADKFLAESFTVKELSEVAKQIRGKKVTISGRAEDIVQGAALFGPKIGQGFLQNLRGNYVPVTIDLWMRRTWGRWTGDVMEVDPLTPERVSRLLEGARAKGLVLPQQMKTMRTVARSRKGGSTYTTLSDALVEKIRDDRGLRDVIFSVTEDLVKEWGNRYKSVKKFAVRPEDLKAVRDGSLSFDALTDRQMAILKRLDVQYGRYVEQQKTAPEGTEKLPKDLWRQSQLQALGHTEMLTNKDISNIKPEWASSAIVIQNALGPIDVPNDQDREVITRLVNDIRGRLKQQGIETTNADIQAILWYPEKDIWAKLSDGTADSDLKQSYDTEFLKIAESRGLGDKARAALQQAETDRAPRTGSGTGPGKAL